jgi:hypothetical protein
MATPLGHQGVALHPHGAKGVAKTAPNGGLGVVSATPLGHGSGRATPWCPRGWPKPPPVGIKGGLGGGFAHPSGPTGVAEPPPIPTGGGYDQSHPLGHKGVAEATPNTTPLAPWGWLLGAQGGG